MSIAVNLGRVMIMRQVADWLAKHATLPISYVTVHENGSVTISPSHKDIDGGYADGKAEIHNLYAIAEVARAEVSISPREYASGWHLTVSWHIGQIPAEAQVFLPRMAADVRPPKPVESGSPEASAADPAPELVAAHA